MAHPAVPVAAVAGAPDEPHGEEAKAFAILKPGNAATPGELVSRSRENMAARKYPRTVQVAGALPVTAAGKILKRELSGCTSALPPAGPRPGLACPGRGLDLSL